MSARKSLLARLDRLNSRVGLSGVVSNILVREFMFVLKMMMMMSVLCECITCVYVRMRETFFNL